MRLDLNKIGDGNRLIPAGVRLPWPAAPVRTLFFSTCALTASISVMVMLPSPLESPVTTTTAVCLTVLPSSSFTDMPVPTRAFPVTSVFPLYTLQYSFSLIPPSSCAAVAPAPILLRNPPSTAYTPLVMRSGTRERTVTAKEIGGVS